MSLSGQNHLNQNDEMNLPVIFSKEKLHSTRVDDDISSECVGFYVESEEFLFNEHQAYPVLIESQFQDFSSHDQDLEEIVKNPAPKAKPIKRAKVSVSNKKKNSNIIKKIGRIIIDNIQSYVLPTKRNKGVESMLDLLQSRSETHSSLKDPRDGFNLSHLQALYADPESSSINLVTSRRIFSKNLREEVFGSCQIKMNNKVLYLNSLKCSAIRFMNSKLAVRLQISQQSH